MKNVFYIFGILLVTLIIAIGCSTNIKQETDNLSSSPNIAAATQGNLPDLVVTHIWSTGTIITYEVQNNGTAKSELCVTYLYQNNKHVASSYTQPILPGEKKRFQFPNYVLAHVDIGTGAVEYTEAQIQAMLTLKVCVDAKSTLIESNKANNCLIATPSQYKDLSDLLKGSLNWLYDKNK